MNNWKELDHKNIWHPFTPLQGAPEPIFIKSANGVYLETDDGRKIIDAVSSWWVNIHGHSNPILAKALFEQASKLEHVIFAGFTHEPAIQLSKNLLSILPENQKKIFFSDNGSTAVEVALKMAMQYWHHQGEENVRVVALEGAYHGDTFGAMSVGDRGIFTTPFNKFLFNVEFIPFPSEQNEQGARNKFLQLLKDNLPTIFIYEPLVQGASGMRMYSIAVLEEFLTLAKANNWVTVADEVFTGFGRTGKLFASDYVSIKPDIMAVSKGITGGTMPLGVTSCSQKIIQAFQSDDLLKTFFHGHSYTANPLSCAVANASYTLLMQDPCKNQIQLITELHKRFASQVNNRKQVKEVRQLGTILAIELNAGNTSYTNELRKKIYPYFLQRNILIRPLGNVIYILPPYIISKEELNKIYEAIIDFLNTMEDPE